MHSRSASLAAVEDPLPTPDVSFRLVLSVYTAALLSPGIAAVVTSVVSLTPAGAYVTLVTAGTLLLVGVGVVAGRVEGLAVRLGAGSLGWTLPLFALFATGGYVALTLGDTAVGGTFTALGMITAAGATMVGLLARRMAHSRYVAAVVGDAEPTVEWTAGWTARRRTTLGVVATVCMLFGLASFFGDLLPGGPVVEVAGALAYVAGAALIGYGAERTYRVTDHGLEHATQIGRRLIAWADVAGVEVTDTELLLRRRSWYRPTLRCALDHIEDPDAVAAALEDHLEER